MTAPEANRIPMNLSLQFKAAAGIAAMTMFAGCATPALWDLKVHSPASAPTLKLSPQTEDVLVHYDEKCSGSLSTSTPSQTTSTALPGAVAATGRKKRTRQSQPRAYWLFASTNMVRHHSPEFVVVTNSTDWVSVPVVPLDMMQPITNRADFIWVRRDTVIFPAAKSGATKPVARTPMKAPHSIAAGTNVLGQRLYMTNAAPEHGYYWKLSSSPPRYLLTTNASPEHGYYAVLYGDKLLLWHDGREAGQFTLPAYSTHGRTTFWRVALTPIAVSADVALVGTLLAVGIAAGAAH